MNEKDKIIDKIKKLYALSTSPNEEEAKSALNKAHELLIKYHIDFDSIDDVEFKEKFTLFERQNIPDWGKVLANIVADYFYCKFHTSYRKQGKFFVFIGTDIDTQIADYTFEYLFNVIKKLLSFYKKTTKYCTSNKVFSYSSGLVAGIRSNLQRQSDIEKGLGLILKENGKFLEWYKNTYKLTSTALSLNSKNRNAYASGYTDGKKIKLRSGVESNPNIRILLGN